MTIHEGMKEAFRRLGATEEEIERNDRLARAALPDAAQCIGDAPIEAGKEEQFIKAYMALTNLIAEGPTRECAKAYLESRHASN